MITLILILILAIAIISVVVDNKSRYGNDTAKFIFEISVFCLVIFFDTAHSTPNVRLKWLNDRF